MTLSPAGDPPAPPATPTPSLSPAEFLSRLPALRRAKSLSQHELADLVGITQSRISGLERGKSITVLDEVLPKLASALGVSLTEAAAGPAPPPADKQPVALQRSQLPAPAPVADPLAAPPVLQHHFALRRGLSITLALPEDLTAQEAARLCLFLRALPFDLVTP